MPVNLLQERHILPSARIELAEPNLPGDLKKANCTSEYAIFATVSYRIGSVVMLKLCFLIADYRYIYLRVEVTFKNWQNV